MTLKYRSTARKRSQNKCPKMKFGAFISDPVLCIYLCKYTHKHIHIGTLLLPGARLGFLLCIRLSQRDGAKVQRLSVYSRNVGNTHKLVSKKCAQT